jgi:hypothetical protein
MTDETAVEVTFINNPLAPDIFANGATGFSNSNGVIMVTFEAHHVDHSTAPGPLSRVVIGRLVMPIQGAQSLALGLFDFLKNQGLDPTAAISGGQKPN